MERTLSENESKVVLDLEWRGQKTVTLDEIQAALACSGGYARFMAHKLVKKGWLERLRPGLFQLVPAERGREGVADTNPLAAGAVLVSPYFFSFGTACTHHGLTEQVFSDVYLATPTRRRPQVVRGKRYVFVPVAKDRFFGFTEIKVLGATVQMATIERALVDAIDRPRYAGGIGEVSRIVARASGRVSWNALLEHLRRFDESALVQRLGYLLDLNRSEVPRETLAVLHDLVRPESKIVLGPRKKWGLHGPLSRAWNVIENVPREVLLAGDDKPKRRVTFAKRGER
ncbi:MAG: type IV toxin-antitoxin system AbiEi family antitoxin domain-containing protein [Deltaproteobacteria bacterium]|nr:type IV toxin-antitoxin system AbiEi family antitoxin domain-containing protein [Deltaproteobacteria bacterium]